MVDQSYRPPTKTLPKWNIRVEYWVEGIGDNYGTDTNEAGAFLHLSTDQVRFYRIDAAQVTGHASGGGYELYGEQQDQPMVLAEIPPLVFSEIMRDVDLFVGVASVGNDPRWTDGGRDVRQNQYWHDASFGDLSASAQTRKAVLERIIPRLK